MESMRTRGREKKIEEVESVFFKRQDKIQIERQTDIQTNG